MQSAIPRPLLTIFLCAFLILVVLNLTAPGQAFAKGSSKDGRVPFVGLLAANGNLYGTTVNGGAFFNGSVQGDGTVFQLTPNGVGGWTESILHSFNGTDGKFPQAGLVTDGSGNLYGTTIFGGANFRGTVFELSPPAKGGNWTESILLSFDGSIFGNGAGGLSGVFGTDGANLYGTAQNGGSNGYGTAFKLTRSGGTWSPSVLHNFGSGADGSTPLSLIRDTGGNLYGTTKAGGTHGAGTVFELTPGGTSWTESLLYSFAGAPADGQYPVGLIRGTGGDLYGATRNGGPGTSGDSAVPPDGAGTVFKLTNNVGTWAESVLYDFTGGADGNLPSDVTNVSGILYGTTQLGGTGHGTVYALTPDGFGGWTESIIHTFAGGVDGEPAPNLIADGSGNNLYGTTPAGGASGLGTVFKLTNNAGVWSYSVLYSFM